MANSPKLDLNYMNHKSNCSNCKFYNSGFCKKKNFNVSVNSMWCKDFSLLNKIIFSEKLKSIKNYVISRFF